MVTPEVPFQKCTATGQAPLLSIWYILYASPICFSDARQVAFSADFRAALSTGNSTEIKIAMIPMTTSNSTRVKARRALNVDLSMGSPDNGFKDCNKAAD